MNKTKVLFIVLPYVVHDIDANRPKIRSFHAVPYGLLSVATYNKDYANIKIIDCDATPNYQEVVKATVKSFKPEIVGFSMMFDNSYQYLTPLSHDTREINERIIQVVGGAAASYSYEEILTKEPFIDAVCYSEGEIPFYNLLNNFTTDGWVVHEDLKRRHKPKAVPIMDLDKVIDIDYSFINPEDYNMQQAFSPYVDYSKPHKQFFISTTRGCPFKCTFCSNASIHGKKMRFASVDAIINHVRYLCHFHDMDVLTIYDDQLLIDVPRAKELFKRLAPFELRIEMPNGLSVRYIDEEMAVLMRSAGVDTAYLAIEHGSEYVLKELIRKPLELSMVAPAVEALRKADIFVHAFIVLGMPGETAEHRRECMDFLKEVDVDWAGFNLATPVKGSQLYEDCIKNGWIKPQDINDVVDKKYIIRIPGVDHREVELDAELMNLSFNFFDNRRIRIGDYETAAACFEEVLRRYTGHEWASLMLTHCKGVLKRRDL